MMSPIIERLLHVAELAREDFYGEWTEDEWAEMLTEDPTLLVAIPSPDMTPRLCAIAVDLCADMRIAVPFTKMSQVNELLQKRPTLP